MNSPTPDQIDALVEVDALFAEIDALLEELDETLEDLEADPFFADDDDDSATVIAAITVSLGTVVFFGLLSAAVLVRSLRRILK